MRAFALLLVLASASAFAPAMSARTARSTVSMIQRGPRGGARAAAKVRAREQAAARRARFARGRRTGRRRRRAPTLSRAARARAHAGLTRAPSLRPSRRARRAARHRAQPAAKKGGRFSLPQKAAAAPAPSAPAAPGLSWFDYAFGGVPATKLTPTAAVTKGWEGLGNDEWRIKFARRHGFLLKEDDDVFDDNLTFKERENIAKGQYISIVGQARNFVPPELTYRR